jgi:hypothetical protein
MTYNQIVLKITDLLESNKFIKTVRFSSPNEWIGWTEMPVMPVASFVINNGQLNAGREIVYSVTFWFLDKSGIEGQHETQVVNDQLMIANDIISSLRNDQTISLDPSISWEAISEKFEDYLSGVTTTFNISLTGKFGLCDFPT